MIPYFILVAVPIIPLLTRYKGIKFGKHAAISKKTLPISLFFAVLFLLVSLRADIIGNDTRNYIYYFDLYGKMPWEKLLDVKEPAYALLNKIVSCFSSNPNIFFLITAFIYIVPIAKLYIENIEFPMLTIALFVTMSTFSMWFSGIRQSIAIALGVIAFYFVKEKKVMPFAFVVLLAMMFHRSSFMITLMYPLYHLRITKKWLFFVAPGMLATLVFNKPIFSFLGTLISDLYEVNIQPTGAYTMIILFALLSAFSYIVPDETKMDETTLAIRNYLLLATTIQMFAPVNTLAMRMNYYFIIFIPILIPKIIKASSAQWRLVSKLAGWTMTVFFILYFFVDTTTSNALSIYPYHFFWEV